MKKNKQGLRDLSFSNTNNRQREVIEKCTHEWKLYKPRQLGATTTSTADTRHECEKCGEISIERFIAKEFKHGEL